MRYYPGYRSHSHDISLTHMCKCKYLLNSCMYLGSHIPLWHYNASLWCYLLGEFLLIWWTIADIFQTLNFITNSTYNKHIIVSFFQEFTVLDRAYLSSVPKTVYSCVGEYYKFYNMFTFLRFIALWKVHNWVFVLNPILSDLAIVCKLGL